MLLARALVHDPRALILDEPSTALDFTAAMGLTTVMRELLAHGHTLVLVTHHPGEIPPEIDRVILMQDGRIVKDGPKEQLLTGKVLSELFGVTVEVTPRDGFFHAW